MENIKYNSKIKTKKICFSAMFAAIIFGLTLLHVPIGAGGYVHLGDAAIYLVAMLIGGPWAFLSAAVGASLCDVVSGFAVYAPATLIIKVLIAIPFVIISKKSDKIFNVFSAVFTVLSGLITIGGYYLADLVIFREGAIADIPANAIQALGSAVLFIILALACDRAGIKAKIKEFIYG